MIDESTIIAKSITGLWVANFEGESQCAIGSDMPVRAARRLLEEVDAEPGTFTLLCHSDNADEPVLRYSLVWDPPELLVDCSECRGTGQYTGLQLREVCQRCNGRTVIPI